MSSVAAARFPIRFATGVGVLLAATGMPPSRSYVELRGDTMSVRMGWAFTLDAPRSAIASVVAIDNPPLLAGIGVHGWRGHWLVNGSLQSVVRVQFDPPVPARAVLVPVRLETLDVSLEDPGGFMSLALPARP